MKTVVVAKTVVAAAVLGVSALAIAVLLVEWNVIAPASPQLSTTTTASSLAPASPQVSAATTAPSALIPAQENIRTVTLRVDGLWCPGCSYIVRRALMGTPGVVDAKVSMRTKSAIVTYDRSKTAVAALTAATTNYGFPSQIVDEFTSEVDQLLGRP